MHGAVLFYLKDKPLQRTPLYSAVNVFSNRYTVFLQFAQGVKLTGEALNVPSLLI